MTQQAATKKTVFQSFHYIGLAAAVLLYLLIVVSEFARRTGAGLGISEWLLLPATLLIALAAASAWRSYRRARWITAPLFVSLIILVVQIVLIVIRLVPGTSPGMVTAYLSNVLLVHALAITSTVVAFRYREQPSGQLTFQTSFARLTLLVLGVTFVSMVSGVFVTVTGSAQMCAGWPLCEGGLQIPQNPYEWLHLLHQLIVLLNSVLVAGMLAMGWRTQRFQPAILVSVTAGSILFFAQALIGAVLVVRDFSIDLIGLHAATAAAVWAVLIVVVVQVGLAGRTPEGENLDAFQPVERSARLRDFLTLTKPIIVLLLLVTTYAGMVVGAQAFPSFSLTFWTLLGGALAAGGSGAINQYIDRDLDKMMKRTSRRPLAANRLSPAEGLAFGVGLCLTAFYIMAVFTNLLAALLSVVGMFYYVWIYSILLKKATVQNIVIGGGAGALPPLVGWAATTGELTFPALMLFMIVFLWTPPHFWALALVRIKDYARGGVPMMPVVHGERETLRQMLIYSVVLVAVTLLCPLAGIGGWLYGVAALLMGGALLYYMWELWRNYSPKLAWRIYRYTSMYLAFLFLFMVIDAVI